MNTYRFILEKYRGRSTRHTCPQCGRKHTFTRYIDTENNNQYLSERVGKCNRLDKCGYHYTPREYFADNPHKRDKYLVEDGSLRPCGYHYTPREYFADNPQRGERGAFPVSSFPAIGKSEQGNRKHSVQESSKLIGRLPRWFMESTLDVECDYKVWLYETFGDHIAGRIIRDYYIGGSRSDDPELPLNCVIFWQVDCNNDVRTGKIMNYDLASGKRIKGDAAYVNWVHSIMRSEGSLPEEWELEQCLYGEHLLSLRPTAVVALAEGPKTAHIGSALMPAMVWVAVDSMMGLSLERLRPLKGRSVVLFPDQGKGYEEWVKRIDAIAQEVGFDYTVSQFVETHAQANGDDVGDVVLWDYVRREEECPF